MKNSIILLVLVTLFSCNSSQLTKDFNCKTNGYGNLETLTDFKKNFKVKIPKTWKTNYYYDNVVSSIHSADTTLNLTQTTIFDVSFVTSTSEIDQNFINKIKKDNENMGLKEIISKNTTLLNRPTYYNLSDGKRGKYSYKILNIFTKANIGFLHIKTEVYGDSLVDERICKAIDLINDIRLN